MSEIVKLEAALRTVTGKKVKQLRAQDQIPAVIYGQKMEGAVPIQIEREVLRLLLRAAGGTNVIEISAGGNQYNVLVREVQRDVMDQTPLHIDFYSVDLDVRLSAEVPVVTVGVSPIVESGEVMLITPNTLVIIEALPTNIPNELQIDISRLEDPSDLLTASDLPLPEGVTMISDPEMVLARTEIPREEEEEEEEEEEGFFDEDTSVEPELVGRDREEEIEED
ncbi:MAG: 50S ribosomal protein L25 [Anaerolineae bacterium]|nr:50S ribosomal protein L25 [Anaerolineae bacterium]